MLKNEREEAVRSDAGGSKKMTGDEAFAHLSSITGTQNVE